MNNAILVIFLYMYMNWCPKCIRKHISFLINWQHCTRCLRFRQSERTSAPLPGHKLNQTLLWCHNGRDGISISNHQPHDCLLNRVFRCRSKKTSKFSVTGLYAVNSSETGEFPAKMAHSAKNIPIWWCHHEKHTTRNISPNFLTELDLQDLWLWSLTGIFNIFTTL